MSAMRKLKVAAGATVVIFAAHAYQSGALATPAASGAHLDAKVGGGTLDCAGLEHLWEQAGGSRSAAFMAAEIAMAESTGRQYATDLNGGASTDRGYWQINDAAHGSLSTYDAYANARAAVLISSDGTNWNAWVTYKKGAYVGQC